MPRGSRIRRRSASERGNPLGAFLVDESLPRSVTRLLTERGHDVHDVRDIGLRGAADGRIAAHAVSEGRILVTADLDFSNALRFPPGTHPGIVVVRVPVDWGVKMLAERAVAAIEEAGAERLRGTIAIVEASRARIFGART
jgi:predicted nuclease of predicted toxin-antitoxin system